MTKTKIYLASPWWHEDEQIREARHEIVTRRAGKLMQDGYVVFSPITHSVPIAEAITSIDEHKPDGKYGHDFWLDQDSYFLQWCDEMWVLKQEGWIESFGVNWEIDFITKLNKPIRYIHV